MNTPRRFLVLAAGIAVALGGCDAGAKHAHLEGPNGAAVEVSPQESWDVYYMQGAKIGYGHLLLEKTQDAGQTLVRTTIETSLTVRRFGQVSEQRTRCA